MAVQIIGGAKNRDNTDDVGLASPKVGVDSPKRVRYYFHSKSNVPHICVLP